MWIVRETIEMCNKYIHKRETINMSIYLLGIFPFFYPVLETNPYWRNAYIGLLLWFTKKYNLQLHTAVWHVETIFINFPQKLWKFDEE